MTETISFSLPKEMADAIKQFAATTNRKGSAVALMAFREFFEKPEVKEELSQAQAAPTAPLPQQQ